MDKYEKLIKTIDEQKETLLKLKGAAASGKGVAVKAFDKGMAKLWALHFPDLPFFKNKAAVWEYLKSEGYKVGRQKVYEAAKSGDLKVQADHRVFKADVAARNHISGGNTCVFAKARDFLVKAGHIATIERI